MRSVSLLLVALASADSSSEVLGLLQPKAFHKHVSNTEPVCKLTTQYAPKLNLNMKPMEKWDTRSENIDRVIMLDFPTTGSSWLRMVMRRVSWLVGMKSNIGAIYPEEPFTKQPAFEQVFVDDGWDPSFNSVIFKTHWPADSDLENDRLDAKIFELHNASMHFDRAVVLLRHPNALVKANHKRWPSDCYQDMTCVANGIACWANFWDQALEEKRKQGKVHLLRYEDLCINPVKKIKGVFDFVGPPYDAITEEHLASYFTGNYTDWRECLYSEVDLHDQANSFDPAANTGDVLPGQAREAGVLDIFKNTMLNHWYENFTHI